MLKNHGQYWANGNPPNYPKIFTIAILRLWNGYNIAVSESVRNKSTVSRFLSELMQDRAIVTMEDE